MRGRKPIPSHLKIVRGTSRKDRENLAEPEPGVDRISPPPHLTGDALEHFEKMSAELLALGVMTNTDIDLLALYCVSHANMLEALRNINAEQARAETLREDLEALAEWDDDAAIELERLNGAGIIDRTRSGYRQQSVWIQIYNKSLEQMHKLGAEFGLSPSSRTRIASTKGEKDPEGWGDV